MSAIFEKDLTWTEKPVIGLLLMNAEFDSNANPIDPEKYYYVAKHKPTGQIAIREAK